MSQARFDWDSDKDLENRKKHGVSFAEAQFAIYERENKLYR